MDQPSLPAMTPEAPNPIGKLLALLKPRNVAFAMVAVMFTFAGAFTAFTYLRPFLEIYTHVSVPQPSLLPLGLGAAGFIGTYGASAHEFDTRGNLVTKLARPDEHWSVTWKQ